MTEYEFIIVVLVGVVIGRILSSFVPAPKWLVRWLERKHD